MTAVFHTSGTLTTESIFLKSKVSGTVMVYLIRLNNNDTREQAIGTSLQKTWRITSKSYELPYFYSGC